MDAAERGQPRSVAGEPLTAAPLSGWVRRVVFPGVWLASPYAALAT
jgi:hypothetical protein